MKNHKGFSLIELLIVVVIIGIVAAIAIPNLLAARVAANEASAIASLRTYHSAQLVYQATKGAGRFAGANLVPQTSLASPADDFTELASQNLIDEVLATGVKSGYMFGGGQTMTPQNVAQFWGMARPVHHRNSATQWRVTGRRNFCILTDGVLKFDQTPTAGGLSFRYGADGAYILDGGEVLGSK